LFSRPTWKKEVRVEWRDSAEVPLAASANEEEN